ncbi:MAG: acyl-CoA dehydrogenase [Oceanicaulis sp.]
MGLRKSLISKPLMGWFKGLLPEMSDTEAQAIEAGTVWWDANLVSGKPDWDYLRNLKVGLLTKAEQDFIEGPTRTLCAMLDDWEIEHELNDLPREVWDYLIGEGFFAMIIPEEYGGKGFSAYAHSEVVRMIATRSISAAVTVMVPNSLGPGELLLLYGTKEQQDHYLPRLAKGEDIPCFALTGVEAGSDASAMTDYGVIVEKEIDGEKKLGVSITCNKRYITLAPVATLAGLAVRLYDPDGLVGPKEDLGITVLLVPTDTPGLETGRRHYPAGIAFQNGPVRGEDVFVGIEQILGGEEQIGQGWKMLMGALAAGRGISLPSLSAAGAAVAARSAGGYARIRQQFGMPVGGFEGVREKLAPIAASAYTLDGARLLTCAGIDEGEKPAVVSAIMKYHATERLRMAINDAMDVFGGKTICEGPRDHLATAYKALPVAITVEGANILTRSLIIFGQGAIRCHPYLLTEMQAVQNDDKKAGLDAFDTALFGHLGWQLKSAGRSIWHGLTGGRFAHAPDGAGELERYYKHLSRASAQLAIATEISLATLGGALKKKESLSARLGDMLAELYLLSGALKRFEHDGRPAQDKVILDYVFEDGLHRFEERLKAVQRHFPNPFWRVVLTAVTSPAGLHRKPPHDSLMNAVAETIQTPGETRERLGHNVYLGSNGDTMALIEKALHAVIRRDQLLKPVKKQKLSLDEAVRCGVISRAERDEIEQTDALVREVLVVDDFDPSQLKGATLSPSARKDETAAA